MVHATVAQLLRRGVKMIGRLASKVCVITGTGSGIGREAALRFCREGADVVGCDINAEAAQETVDMAKQAGFELLSLHPADLTNPTQCKELVALAEKAHGGVDVVFNNAGRTQFAFMDDITPDIWDFNIKSELSITFYMCHAAWPALTRRGGGCIINMASIAGHVGFRTIGNISHAAAKGAISSMTRQLALEGGKHKIRANALSPGPIRTSGSSEFFNTNADFERVFDTRLILERLGEPRDIVNLAVFLASDEANFMTGSDVIVDGGYTAF
jgi:NAD(P)-dependent dehydrogenase (short-subunit alcohol dehydrogenase family)